VPCTCPGSHASGIGQFGVSPGVGLMPTMPQNDAGIRIEQPKSVPCANGAIPVATATADPPEEPAGLNAGFQGLRVTPNTSLKVLAPAPNSGVLVLPSTMAPAAFSRATTSASSSGTWCSKILLPHVVRMPLVGVRSLIDTGTPCSGPRRARRRAAAVARFAASTACCAVTLHYAFWGVLPGPG